MKITNDISLTEFKAWSGAVDTKQTIIDNNKVEEFDSLINELYPDGILEGQLNDLLWFESEWLYKSLCINDDEEEE